MSNTLAIASTNVVEVLKLKDETTGLLVTNAYVTCTLLDKTGAQVAGAIGIVLAYVSAILGYRGFIPATVTLVAGPYTARITAVSGAYSRQLDLPVIARAA